MNAEELAAFFHEQVEPTYHDFVRQLASKGSGSSQDRRYGLLAALAAYHFREQLDGALSLTTEQVAQRCSDYALLRDVADVAKHRHLNRASALLKSAEAVHEVLVVTVFEDDFGEYRDAEKVVELSLPKGQVRRLDDVITNVMAFWDAHLRSHNIPLLATKFECKSRSLPIPREECGEVGRQLNIVRGLRFSQAIRLQRYDYDSRKAEPVDLSGSEVRFRIYKPKYEIDVVLTHEETGQELRRTVALGPEQDVEFEALKSDEERQAYLLDALQIREAYGRLAAEAKNIEGSKKG